MNDIELCQELMKRAEEYQKRKEREFAIEELEKLRPEINDNPQVYSDEYFVSVKFVNKVLDKHIAELDCINDCEHCEYVECPKGE